MWMERPRITFEGGLSLSSLNRALDRFCYKHPNFGVPNLMRFIVFGNVIVFLLYIMNSRLSAF
jgi:hypothetical protein